MPIVTKGPEAAYATKDNIVYPGPFSAAVANARAEDQLDDFLAEGGSYPVGTSRISDGGVPARLQTALVGDDNDVVLVAKDPGVEGNDITVALVDPAGNDEELAVAVSDTDISVSLATGVAGAITTTGAELVVALNDDEDASALVLAENAPSNDGSVEVTALAETALTGGPDADVGGLPLNLSVRT